MTQWLKPLSIAYIKEVRHQVVDAVAEAKERGRKFTPLFWTGNHLNPVRIGLILNSNYKSRKSGDK